MSTRFVEVPVSRRSVNYVKRFVAQIQKDGYYQDGKCFTGSFNQYGLQIIFRSDSGVHFTLDEIEKLWMVDSSEFPKFVNFGDSVMSGGFQFTSPELKNTPLQYYVVNHQTQNGFLSLYLAIPVKVLKAVMAANIYFEDYRVCPAWGKPFVENDQYRYDLVMNVPVRYESDIPSINVSNACSKLILQANIYFSRIDSYLQLLYNLSHISSTVEVTYRDTNIIRGVFLDGQCRFQAKPLTRVIHGVTEGNFVIYQSKVSVNSQTGWELELSLPADFSQRLLTDLQQSGSLLGQPLNEKWGTGFFDPPTNPLFHTCKFWRKGSAIFYHQPEGFIPDLLNFIYEIEKQLRCRSDLVKTGGYKSFIHLEDL